MSDERYRDFDDALAEGEGTPIRFKVRGQEFELPPDIPAAVVLKAVRLRAEYPEDATIPHLDLVELALAWFGEKDAKRLLDTGISELKLSEIVAWVMTQYGVPASAGNSSAPAPPTDE